MEDVIVNVVDDKIYMDAQNLIVSPLTLFHLRLIGLAFSFYCHQEQQPSI